MIMASEIGPGSRIEVDHRRRNMQAVQVIDRKTVPDSG
jgi:hypothetical protein